MLVNPSIQQIRDALAQYIHLRGFVSHTDDVYVWPAEDMLHYEAVSEVNRGGYAGMMVGFYIEKSDGEEYICGHYAGEHLVTQGLIKNEDDWNTVPLEQLSRFQRLQPFLRNLQESA